MSDVVRVERDGGVATLLLNRPEKRNALNGEVVAALTAAVAETAADPDVRVVCLRGAGRDFCAGADLAELQAIATREPMDNVADAQRLGDLLIALRRHPRPVVAAVHGKALAGGCGLATACDLVWASDDALFGYPEVHLGFVPAMVLSLLRRKVGEARAFDLVIRGRWISAADAESMGLINRSIPAADFERAVAAELADLAALPPSALELTKRLFYGVDGLSVADGIGRGAEVNAIARQTEECRAGVRAFLGRNRDRSEER